MAKHSPSIFGSAYYTRDLVDYIEEDGVSDWRRALQARYDDCWEVVQAGVYVWGDEGDVTYWAIITKLVRE